MKARSLKELKKLRQQFAAAQAQFPAGEVYALEVGVVEQGVK